MEDLKRHTDASSHAASVQQLRGLPHGKGQLATKLALATDNYFKAGVDQAARDDFLRRGYHKYLKSHHNIAGNKAVDGQVCPLLGAPSMLPRAVLQRWCVKPAFFFSLMAAELAHTRQELLRYADYIAAPSSLPLENKPSSLGFKFGRSG